MSSLTSLLLCLFLGCAWGGTFKEEFDAGWESRWIYSNDEKYKGQFVVETFAPDVGLKVPTKALHYGLTTSLDPVFDPEKGVTLQFEARYSETQTCSGAYMKFYSQDPDFKPEAMTADTRYTVMFGPDVCGATSKVHLILNHKNPLTGEIQEKHLTSPPRVKVDKKTHVYTASLLPDNTFQVMVDGKIVSEGSLFEKFDPPINPPKEIPDPEDKKPEDWVDDPKMDDPEAVKPDDWVEEPMMDDPDAKKPEGWLDDTPLEIPDPSAVKPEGWDDAEDGEWVAPTVKNPLCSDAPGCGEWKPAKINNPEYKGPWKPPKIDNPAYKGEWKQATIANPDYYRDDTPLKSMASIGAAGFEIWTMDEGIFFDNIVITTDLDFAAEFREKWSNRSAIEKAEEEAKQESKQKEQDMTIQTEWIADLLEIPWLSFLGSITPVIIWLENQGQGFWGGVVIMTAMLLTTLLRRCLKAGKKKDSVGERKKQDISEPDDPPQDPSEPSSSGAREEQEEEDEDEKPEKTSRRSN